LERGDGFVGYFFVGTCGCLVAGIIFSKIKEERETRDVDCRGGILFFIRTNESSRRGELSFRSLVFHYCHTYHLNFSQLGEKSSIHSFFSSSPLRGHETMIS